MRDDNHAQFAATVLRLLRRCQITLGIERPADQPVRLRLGPPTQKHLWAPGTYFYAALSQPRVKAQILALLEAERQADTPCPQCGARDWGEVPGHLEGEPCTVWTCLTCRVDARDYLMPQWSPGAVQAETDPAHQCPTTDTDPQPEEEVTHAEP
jgi:hypothetical protein